MFVSDERAGVVRRISARGEMTVVASGLRNPQGLAVAGDQLLVAEAAAGRIVGLPLAAAGAFASRGSTVWDGLVLPAGLATADSCVFVASAGQHAVFRRDLRCEDVPTVIAGIPGSPGNMKHDSCGDGGEALAARLNSPLGIAVDGSGDVYIADSYNGRVRAVCGGILRTIAGADQSAPRGNRGIATEINIGQARSVACGAGGLYISAAPGLVWDLRGGEAIPIAGTFVDGYNFDEGDATEIRLNVPCGITVWNNSLVIADSDNQRVCLVDLT